jgi:hypothetical protein
MVDRALSRTHVPQSIDAENEAPAKATARAPVAPMSSMGISAMVERIGSKR